MTEHYEVGQEIRNNKTSDQDNLVTYNIVEVGSNQFSPFVSSPLALFMF